MFIHLSNLFPLQPFPTNHSIDRSIRLSLGCCTETGKHPIVFDSNKYIPEELNYDINDKGLLGTVWALKCWWDFLFSLSFPFEVLNKHSSPQYFITTKVLTTHQPCWAEFLSEFHFSITDFPGHLASLSDSLSLGDNIYPEREEDFIGNNEMNFQKLINKDEFKPSKSFSVNV
ncbi:hypothetical protein O181_039911 [Austropuccinia psidii MF-1]|uniref:Reverse transcriptase RNase H-like domain-containing protein n=1 Tax=Austropuccinia psidii MF-1 TaxID=1389203 RepID=A0A9Q3DGT1_9BASI|nr:hypothetical protein [Austropuccinia psidii MF-1]